MDDVLSDLIPLEFPDTNGHINGDSGLADVLPAELLAPDLEPPQERVAQPVQQCDASRWIPARVWGMAEAHGGTPLLLANSCSADPKSFVRIQSLTENISSATSNWEEIQGVTGFTPIAKGVLVLKRCGVSNSEVNRGKDGSICPNHLELLTTHFPVEKACKMCTAPLSADEKPHAVSPLEQDVLSPFIPGLFVGQIICDTCSKKVNGVVPCRTEAKTLCAFTRALSRAELPYSLSDLNLGDVLSPTKMSFPTSLNGIEYATVSLTVPFQLSTSRVPPLRYKKQYFSPLNFTHLR